MRKLGALEVPDGPDRTLAHSSASQVESFAGPDVRVRGGCRRRWWFSRFGLRSPATASQALGTAVHLEYEYWLPTEVWPGKDSRAQAIAARGAATLPTPGPDLATEVSIDAFAGRCNTAFVGKVDLVSPRRLDEEILDVFDHKTCKDYRFVKSSEDLANNPQGLAYAYAGFRLPIVVRDPAQPWIARASDVDRVAFSHHYVLTDDPGGSRLSSVTLGWSEVARGWAKVEALVDEQVEACATWPDDPLGVPGNFDECRKFGGCWFAKKGACRDSPHLERLIESKALLGVVRKGKTMGESLSDRLARKRGEKAAAAEAPKGPQTCKGERVVEVAGEAPKDCPGCADCAAAEKAARESAEAQKVVSDDAPPREQSAADEAVNAAGKRKPRGKAAKAAAEKQEAEVDAAVAKAATPATPIVLVDVLPTSSEIMAAQLGAAPVLADAWLATAKREACEEFGVEDLGFMDFGKGRHAMVVAVRAAVSDAPPPPVILATAFGRWTEAILEVAAEKGWLVLRGVR